MNPVSASPVLAMSNAAVCPAVQDGNFQAILDSSIVAVGAQTIAPVNGTDAAVAAVAADLSVSLATPHQMPPTVQHIENETTDISVTLAEPQQIPAAVRRIETEIGALSSTDQLLPIAAVKIAVADDVKPATAVEDEAIAGTEQAAPVALPILQTQQQPVVASAVAIAVPYRAAAPLPRKKSDDITSATPVIDAPRARPDGLTRFKAAEPEKLIALPPLKLDMASPNTDSFQTRFSVNAAPSAPLTPDLSVSTPVVHLKQLVVAQDREWIAMLTQDIVSNAARDNHLKFTLIPEHLGQLDVALTTDNGKVDVRLEASTAAAAQIISADQYRLIEDLRQSGLKLGQFEMSNRQNGNGQQKAPTPERQNAETTSPIMQPKASAKARGRFA